MPRLWITSNRIRAVGVDGASWACFGCGTNVQAFPERAAIWFAGAMTRSGSSVAPALWLGLAGVVAVAVFFAPVTTGGWCADAPASRASVCGTFERSIVGIDTSLWLWLALSIVVGVITAIAVRSRRSSRP